MKKKLRIAVKDTDVKGACLLLLLGDFQVNIIWKLKESASHVHAVNMLSSTEFCLVTDAASAPLAPAFTPRAG